MTASASALSTTTPAFDEHRRETERLLVFSAGPDDESHGLLGTLTARHGKD